jgi:dihydrodipicolinate synthase/N-acetylneuraminate lyase
MAKYATLFGFGLFSRDNPGYRAYLDRFAKLVSRKKIDVVVLCGGHTNLSFPEKSEAGTMAEYLRPLLGANVRLEVEDRSSTTEENIRFARDHLDLGPGNEVFVVSDSVRFFKAFWIVLHHWFGLGKGDIASLWFGIAKEVYENPRKKSIDIEPRDVKRLLRYRNVRFVMDGLHKDYKSAFHQIISEVVEVESLYDPKIRDGFIEMTREKELARKRLGLE